MAPPRRILREQLEILMDFLEENKDMSKGLPSGKPPSHTPINQLQQAARQKWAALAKKLNNVESGAFKTPDGWKKYWFEWRHKCRRKAADVRRFQGAPDGGVNRFVPLNDLEVRVLELCGKESTTTNPKAKEADSFLDDSDSEPLENIKVRSAPVMKRESFTSTSRLIPDEESPSASPPPKWALDMEERRIAAEERMADALESIATVMKTQEERRAMLEERIADAITTMAGTVHDLNSGIQQTLHHLQRLHPVPTDEPDIKEHIFL